MKALTLHRPWPWAIVHLPETHAKRVENRTWEPPRAMLGEAIAIHAGRHFDVGALDFVAAQCPDDGPLPPQREEEHPLGIVGVARLLGVALDRGNQGVGFRWMEGITNEQGCDAVKRLFTREWFVGPVGWILADVVALPEPVPCKGAQGLWVVPPAIEQLVLAQWRARAA